MLGFTKFYTIDLLNYNWQTKFNKYYTSKMLAKENIDLIKYLESVK